MDQKPDRVTTMVRSRSLKRAWAGQSVGSKLINAYCGVYLVLAVAHWRGLLSAGLLTGAAVPILLRWVLLVVRWIATGSPVGGSTNSTP